MQTPPPLKAGDRVAIVCTARKVETSVLKPALELLDCWKLQVTLGKTIFLEENQFAGTDEARAEDFQAMLDNPAIKAIFIARGGYGTVKIIDRICFKNFIHHPKWVVGYSDITVLHCHITKHCQTETLHATMPVNFSENDPSSLQSLHAALWGHQLSYVFPGCEKNISGQAQARLIGGNLSILYSLTGTPSEAATDGKILFIEDVDEYLYHIDRMFMQLKRSGKLKHLKGLLVGAFTNMKDNTVPFGKTAYDIIYEHVEEYGYPVAFGIPAGHIAANHALIMGRKITLEVTKQYCQIEF